MNKIEPENVSSEAPSMSVIQNHEEPEKVQEATNDTTVKCEFTGK